MWIQRTRPRTRRPFEVPARARRSTRLTGCGLNRSILPLVCRRYRVKLCWTCPSVVTLRVADARAEVRQAWSRSTPCGWTWTSRTAGCRVPSPASERNDEGVVLDFARVWKEPERDLRDRHEDLGHRRGRVMGAMNRSEGKSCRPSPYFGHLSLPDPPRAFSGRSGPL